MRNKKGSRFIVVSFLLHLSVLLFFLHTYGGKEDRVGVEGGVRVTLSKYIPREETRGNCLIESDSLPEEDIHRQDMNGIGRDVGEIQSDIQSSGDTSAVSGARIIRYYKPSYPVLSRIRGEEGRVSLAATIKGDGLVDAVRIEVSSGYERLDRAAINALYKFRFAPAILGNGTRMAEKKVSFIFALNE